MCDLKIILIIIIISLGEILLSYIANTSRTHTPPSQFRLSLSDGSVAESGSIPSLQFNSNSGNINSNSIPNPVQNP